MRIPYSYSPYHSYPPRSGEEDLENSYYAIFLVSTFRGYALENFKESCLNMIFVQDRAVDFCFITYQNIQSLVAKLIIILLVILHGELPQR